MAYQTNVIRSLTEIQSILNKYIDKHFSEKRTQLNKSKTRKFAPRILAYEISGLELSETKSTDPSIPSEYEIEVELLDETIPSTPLGYYTFEQLLEFLSYIESEMGSNNEDSFPHEDLLEEYNTDDPY